LAGIGALIGVFPLAWIDLDDWMVGQLLMACAKGGLADASVDINRPVLIPAHARP
jgi:hypothetical protein